MQGIKIKNILAILLGAGIFSFGFVHFNMQNELGEGGFSGITLILYFTFGWDPAILNIILNIPMFILGWKLLGRRTFIYTVIGTIAVSMFLKVFQAYEFQMHLQDDKLLVALFAGVFIGIGLGIVFRFGGTTGGVDILARLANKYFGWTMGKTMFAFDTIVILVSWATFLDARSMMYTLVAVYIGGRVIDFVQDGAYSAKGALIISNHSDEIANVIVEKMERGVTVMNGRGHFTKENKDILYCVVARNEIVRLKSMIQTIDPHAFVSIVEVREVAGEGFTLDDQKQPLH
ncbi:YitT family protein [Lysinibacillus sp. KU-BSD001]|uniref:YitT family protein n=1 Tax=Lysinibacillus sp. KU-BSD001 TaxID=3141328 RepID=UPI0036E308AD